MICLNTKVVEAIGEPIMGHGETTSRGRRRHVRYSSFSFSFFFFLSGVVLLLNVHVHPVSLVTCSAFCFIR